MIRVVLVEDSPGQRELLEEILRGAPDLALTGVHASAEAALQAVAWKEVDVLLSDLGLPGISGIELIQRATLANPALRSLALTVHEDFATVSATLEAGAAGYVLKGCTAHELVQAVRDVVRNGSPLSSTIARYLVAAFRRKESLPPVGHLTLREEQLLRLVAEGRTQKEVADVLSISPHTVNTHLKNIYSKLQAQGRREAIQRARLLGYLHPHGS